MKATKIVYWLSTILVILLMLFTAVQTFAHPANREGFAKQVQFPGYMFEALAIAKILGSIVLLIPGYPRVKEWVYAGFTFDLTGAIVLFAASSVPFPVAQWAPMLAGGLVLLAISYISYHSILKATPLNS
ncbi:MAG: DoxX family protein [Bacteroidetes bacterium]|nr:DoxX family protein [Bacteroidota bacterium]